MAGWLSVICKNCSTEFSAHEEWRNVSDYCRDCLWDERSCEICKKPLRVRRDWEHPPRVHKECRDAEAANWTERPCRACKTPMRIHRNWRNPPIYCKTCKEAEDAKWIERPCRGCQTPLRIHKSWRNSPIFCKTCKEAEDAKWSERPCKHCGKALRVHAGWKHVPEYHEECAWEEKSCEICEQPLKVHRSWHRSPRAHKECLAEFGPREVTCPDCNQSFVISTATQLRCREKSWELPKRCDRCKLAHRQVQTAVACVRELFRFAVVGTVQEAGTLFEGEVVLISGRRSGEALAEVKVVSPTEPPEYRLYEGVRTSPAASADAEAGAPADGDASEAETGFAGEATEPTEAAPEESAAEAAPADGPEEVLAEAHPEDSAVEASPDADGGASLADPEPCEPAGRPAGEESPTEGGLPEMAVGDDLPEAVAGEAAEAEPATESVPEEGGGEAAGAEDPGAALREAVGSTEAEAEPADGCQAELE